MRSILAQNKCGKPGEMFQKYVFDPEGQTLTDFHKTGTKGKFCGITVQAHHLKRVFRIVEELTGRVPENILEGLNILLPNPKFIYLHRIDKVKQAISFLKARRTGNYRHYPTDGEKEVDYGEYSHTMI